VRAVVLLVCFLALLPGPALAADGLLPTLDAEAAASAVAVIAAVRLPFMGDTFFEEARSASPAEPVRSRDELAAALERAAAGHSGTILVAADGAKIRMMELQR